MSVIKPEMISDRIVRKDMLPISFLKLSPYTGSKRGIRFRLEKAAEGGDASPGTVLRCHAWRGRMSFACTPSEEITHRDFEFDESGIDAAVCFLNDFADGSGGSDPGEGGTS